ncbi:MAG: ABC transporter ATP-binding protein [Desulfobacteraceae bacterium]|nr:ABC transporter ATP-binding protein [Desulfobacteraceae bacterium]
MIKIKDLTKKFGKTRVLDDINLTIKPKDRIALIGPNGAGKTTLIRIILGQYLFNGELLVFDKDPRGNRVEILDRIGYVPQLPPPIQMSIGELVKFSAGISKRSSVDAIYQKANELGLDIEKNIKKPFLKLSGGMKQKLLIALALARQPDILIMDEPAANLDPQGREAFFLQLLKSMEKTTMLLSSHRVDEIINLINRIIEIDYGKVVHDEQIAQSGFADKMLECRVILTNKHEAAIRMLNDWGFNNLNGEQDYEGRFIGAERLRFLTSISHFANHIKKLDISEQLNI